MTRQFCGEKWGKNGHISGKIWHCALWLKILKNVSFLFLSFQGINHWVQTATVLHLRPSTPIRIKEVNLTRTLVQPPTMIHVDPGKNVIMRFPHLLKISQKIWKRSGFESWPKRKNASTKMSNILGPWTQVRLDLNPQVRVDPLRIMKIWARTIQYHQIPRK